MPKVGENTHPPSYTNQVPVQYPNKSLKKETQAFPDTANSSAISTANTKVVTKATRNTGRK